MCLHRYYPDEVVSLESTFEQNGVKSGACSVYYDYKALTSPLLM